MAEDLAVPEAPVAPAVATTEPAAPVPSDEQKPADQAPADTEDTPEKRSGRFARRIDAANRRYGQEKARADFLALEIEKLRPKSVPTAGSPKLEEFNSIEDYATAKAEFVKEQALKEFQTKQQQDRTESVTKTLKTGWEAKTIEAEGKWEDFNEVVGELEPTTPLTAALMRSDPALAYHLGKNPADAKKLAALEPIDQLVALGRLAAKLEAEPPVVKQPSKAPAPIKPVSGTASAPSEELDPEDDMKTFIRKRERQLGRRK